MSHPERHPETEELLRAAFAELLQDEETPLRDHLSGCEPCRLELEEIRETCSEFRTFYQTELKETLPPPPLGWRTFRPALSEQESRGQSLFTRLRDLLSGPPTVRRFGQAAIAACVALVLVTVVYRMREVPAVSANVILNRAVSLQSEALSKVNLATVRQKLQVRAGTKSFTRTLYRNAARKRQVDRWGDSESPSSLAQLSIANEVAGRFRGMHLDWDDPLSPAGIRDWLQERGEHNKSAAGTTVSQSDGAFTLTSTSSQDTVREARFVIRESDYHPVSAHFSFGDSDDLEVIELAYSIQPVESIETTIRAELTASNITAPEPHPGAAAAAPQRVDDSGLDSVEIQARHALHQQRADLGEETRVERTASGVVVKGLVASDQRRAELHAALGRVPGLRIELQTAEEAAARQTGAIASAAETVDRESRQPAVFADALAERFPDQQARDSFVLATLERSQQALSHGFALRNLAERYSAGAVAAVPDQSRRQLAGMVADHRIAIEASVLDLCERLIPFTGPVPQAAGSDNPVRPWQEVQSSLLEDLRRLNQVVVELVSGSAKGTGDAEALVREYRQLAGRVRSGLELLAAAQQ